MLNMRCRVGASRRWGSKILKVTDASVALRWWEDTTEQFAVEAVPVDGVYCGMKGVDEGLKNMS